MPVYNGAAHVESAIASIDNQTLKDWELIVIDDGSTDGTDKMLDSFEDERIRVYHQKNAGVSAARNCGLSRARGSYLTFVDADDVLPTGALELRARFLDQNPLVDIVNGSVVVTTEGREVRRYKPSCISGPLLPRLARLDEEVFFNVLYMVRRSCIGTRRFPVGITHCEDLIFFLELAHDKDLFYGAVEDVIYEYRIQPGSAMSNLDGLERGYLALLDHARSLPRIDAGMYSFMEKRVGSIMAKSWLRRGRVDRALSVLLKVRNAPKTRVSS